jgi:integrase
MSKRKVAAYTKMSIVRVAPTKCLPTRGSELASGYRMFHRLCTKAGVPRLRAHDLRHSCATLLFTMGVIPPTVQRILWYGSIT